MYPIEGNADLVIERRGTDGYNAIGEPVVSWIIQNTLTGFLDYVSGEYRRGDSNAKLADSTHVFVCDYEDISSIGELTHRARHGEDVYDIQIIDNPMGLDYHLEIYLRFTGRR